MKNLTILNGILQYKNYYYFKKALKLISESNVEFTISSKSIVDRQEINIPLQSLIFDGSGILISISEDSDYGFIYKETLDNNPASYFNVWNDCSISDSIQSSYVKYFMAQEDKSKALKDLWESDYASS